MSIIIIIIVITIIILDRMGTITLLVNMWQCQLDKEGQDSLFSVKLCTCTSRLEKQLTSTF